MQVVCAKCRQILEFSGPRPSFCAYCGQALGDTESDVPAPSDPEAVTVAPRGGPAAETAPVPEVLGGYRLLGELGAGGMGVVYEAEEAASGRRVALKVLAPEFAASADAVERFRQEGRLASMVTHPRCVFVLAVDEEAGRPYIVMERMPGTTLADLVERRGPLPPEEAISKILDVIEGLQAAHRLEVIHRDVKPSNCFLEADGRVKVGDFGLAKSLVQDAHLTRTGTFLGTLLFASPEQIRGEAIDPRTDVYSVAATLYYLLTGRAPFQSNDAAATLARIVSDPAPSLRGLRPELPRALDEIVLRGLERDRERRWPDLESFRRALLSLVPEPLTRSSMNLRLAAGFVDGHLLVGLIVLASLGAVGTLGVPQPWQPVVSGALAVALCFAYFLLSEGLAGCSPGKWLVRLRVASAGGTDPPTGGQIALRTALFCLLTVCVFWFADLVHWPALALGCLLLCVPIRPGNGYRALHEILSGTRVLQLPWPRKSPPVLSTGGWLLSFLGSRRLDGVAHAGGLPERIGGFVIRGALQWTAEAKILLGEDASLGRRVFIWLRPAAAPPLERVRRDVGRRTRLRWLGCGRQGDLQWDAFLAPSGCPLPEFVRGEGSLPWAEARPLLESLTDELAAAGADGTMPPTLGVAQVWVQPDGRAQLLDTALTDEPGAGPPAEGADAERALALLRRVAVLTLEGRARDPQAAAAPIRVPLPKEARRPLERLVVGRPGYETLQQWQTDLAATPAR
jgi:uncharacterized RDD family membrane protein YckC